MTGIYYGGSERTWGKYILTRYSAILSRYSGLLSRHGDLVKSLYNNLLSGYIDLASYIATYYVFLCFSVHSSSRGVYENQCLFLFYF